MTVRDKHRRNQDELDTLNGFAVAGLRYAYAWLVSVTKGPYHRQERQERKASLRFLAGFPLRTLCVLREPSGCLCGRNCVSPQQLATRLTTANYYCKRDLPVGCAVIV